MEKNYFIIYDVNEMPIYIDNIYELSFYTGLRIKDINYKFKKSLYGYITSIVDNHIITIYKFC